MKRFQLLTTAIFLFCTLLIAGCTGRGVEAQATAAPEATPTATADIMSGIQTGDNLFLLNKYDVANQIIGELQELLNREKLELEGQLHPYGPQELLCVNQGVLHRTWAPIPLADLLVVALASLLSPLLRQEGLQAAAKQLCPLSFKERIKRLLGR